MWAQTDANGTQFDLAGERVTISTRATAGPLRLQLLTAPTPAARLRAFCRLTGFPALAPEWGYGFWKSRDVHEHQDDVLDDFHGFRRHGIPLDAIVIDSPWATQYNTWDFNPHQFPDAAWMVAMMRSQACARWCGARLGSISTPPTVRSRPSPSPSAYIAIRLPTTRRPRPPATSCASPQESRT